jgi:hypothetical protein
MTQAQASAILGIDQPRVSALLRGKLDLFSLEKLMDFTVRLGNRVDIGIAPEKKSAAGIRVIPAMNYRPASVAGKRTSRS